jgi:hypothetical protein
MKGPWRRLALIRLANAAGAAKRSQLANTAGQLSIDSWPTTLCLYRYGVRQAAGRPVRGQPARKEKPRHYISLVT